MPQGEKICEAKLCPSQHAKQRDYRLDSLFVFCYILELSLYITLLERAALPYEKVLV